jgi:hypothetical protein
MVVLTDPTSLCRRGASSPPRLSATRWNGSICWSKGISRHFVPTFLPVQRRKRIPVADARDIGVSYLVRPIGALVLGA